MAINNNGLIGIDSILQKAEDFVAQNAIGFVQDLRDTLASRTPVKTGRARDSWKVSSDAYTMAGVTDNPPYVGGVEVDVRVRKTNKFLAKPGNGKSLQGLDLKKTTNFIVFSDVPYMARLNRGWSPQAPAGFIEQAVDEVSARWGLL